MNEKTDKKFYWVEGVTKKEVINCWRRLNLDSECQSNFDRGLVANS